ncbi:uncharacterized protein LOC144567205 [Carex rostrata]
MTSDDATSMSHDCTHVVPSKAEMTDGIITTNRLEEIVSAIAAVNSNSSKEGKPSCNDASAHWYKLVHAVAATSDETSIRHFVDKLNGLSLVKDWADMAQKLGNEVTTAVVRDDFIDKLIVSLLNLLNRLPIETCMLADGGILSVLKELGTSKSSIIKEMVSALHDKWGPAEVVAGSSCHLTNSTIPETSESVKDKPEKPNHSADLDISGSSMKGKNVEEGEEEEEAEERVDNPSDPVSPAYSSDSGSIPDTKPVVSPTEKEKKKVETVYDDDMDALEFARQVAIQVEEEVVQYRETLYSSPEEESRLVEVDLPLAEPIEVKNDQNAVDQVCSVPPLKEEESGLTTGTRVEGQVKASNADGSGLDLNENLCTDYETTPELIHVAASKRLPPSSSIPVSPFRFGVGTAANWTGTAAATSAFRPASPRSGTYRHSGMGTPVANSVGLKHKSSSCLAFEFDLNVAETNTAEVNVPPSGDSSTEVSSERTKRLKLDLNFTNEDEVVEPLLAQLPPKSFVFRDHGHSSASSSSLKNQAKFDFDLNDDPYYLKDVVQNGNNVKLMGWNMSGGTVPQNQITPPMFHSFLGPNAAAPSQFGSLSVPSNLYHSPMIPSSSYGHHYSAAPHVWYGQPSTSYAVSPLFTPQQMVGSVSENGPSIGLSLMSGDRSNHFRPGLDLNASSGSVEVTSREVAGFRQFFVQNHGGSVQEPVITATAQPAVQTPGNGVRWREQERERETFSYGFKQLI